MNSNLESFKAQCGEGQIKPYIKSTQTNLHIPLQEVVEVGHICTTGMSLELSQIEKGHVQTFPDWFEFVGSKESIRKQIGMAIPPEGIRIICNAILNTIYQRI